MLRNKPDGFVKTFPPGFLSSCVLDVATYVAPPCEGQKSMLSLEQKRGSKWKKAKKHISKAVRVMWRME
ncbi:MAG: hypothetical protein J6B68_12995 [Lachnospiraceae bacterium]|nr:hypothetical protein [Lachnospiraceae bacterium]